MKKTTLTTCINMRQRGEKIAMLTCYDASFARVCEQTGVDILLVGDSLGMVCQGHDTTVPVNMQEMCYHTQMVKRGNQHALLMADLPFMSYANPEQACKNAAKLMRAGAEIIKLEGGAWLTETIEMLTQRGIPVCAHLGLTPQSVHKLGGFRVQGRDQQSAETIFNDAKTLEQAGASLLLLECVPRSLAADITAVLSIPTIGIGAGNDCSGQVLVLYDVLGLSGDYMPKLAKNFLGGDNDSLLKAIHQYVTDVKSGAFPGSENSFT